jgi:lipopolysaccharide biosynthesis protein
VNKSDNENLDNSISAEIRALPEFQEMKMRAEAAEARLKRIYNTPIWRYSKKIRKLYARLNHVLQARKESKYVFQADLKEGELVIDLARNLVKVEASNAKLDGKPVVIIAQFSKEAAISQSLAKYINGFLNNSFEVVLVSACEHSDELKLDPEIKNRITIIRKPNLGYDFGSWAIALNMFPQIYNSTELILTNDSLIGPLDDFSNIISELRSSPYQVTGITDNSQLQFHIQSYLVHLKNVAVANENMQRFFASITHLGLKNDVILKYELGLTRTAQLSGLYVGALYPWNLVVPPGKNPSLAGWQRMFDLGFPFLKKEAVRLASSAEQKKMAKVISEKFAKPSFAISEINKVSN